MEFRRVLCWGRCCSWCFIDDLEEGLRSEVLKFADDTKIFGRVDSEGAGEDLQRDLDRLVQWSEVWQMRFNVDKCKVMHLGKRNAGGSYVMNGGLWER